MIKINMRNMRDFLLISIVAHTVLFASFFVSNLLSDSFKSSSAQKRPEIMRAHTVEATDMAKIKKEHKKNQKAKNKKIAEDAKKRILKAKQRAQKKANQRKLQQKIKADIALKKQKELKEKQKKFAAEKQRKEEMKLEQAKFKKKEKLLEAKQKKTEKKHKAELAKKDQEEKRKKEAKRKVLAEAKAKKLAEQKRLAAAKLKADEMSEQQKGDKRNKMISKYAALIKQKVERNWRRPLGLGGRQTTVAITLLPNGFVSNVRVVKSSGSRPFDDSVQDALWNSGELPIPTDPEYRKLFTNEPINMRFGNAL